MKKELKECIEINSNLIKNHIIFEVEGKPFGKQRPKFSRRGRFITTYTPHETVAYERKVRESYRAKYGNYKLRSPVKADIIAYYKIPSGTSIVKRKKMLEKDILPQIKPDTDNIAKAILDPLNKLAYEDDAQVVKLNIEKYYNDKPKVIIEIKEV